MSLCVRVKRRRSVSRQRRKSQSARHRAVRRHRAAGRVSTARRTRRVSPKSIPPVSRIELPELLEQAVAATPSLPSKRYPIRNLLVLFLAFAATTAVGSWAVYVTLFGEAHQDIGAGTPPVSRRRAPGESAERRGGRTEGRGSRDGNAEGTGSRCGNAKRRSDFKHQPGARHVPRPPLLKSLPQFQLQLSQPTAAGPRPAPQAPVAAKGKRRGHPEATVIAPTGPGGGAYALVAEARRYLGTNPTGRKDLWCGAFVDLVLKRLGYKGGGNLASAYATLRHARSRPADRRDRRHDAQPAAAMSASSAA